MAIGEVNLLQYDELKIRIQCMRDGIPYNKKRFLVSASVWVSIYLLAH